MTESQEKFVYLRSGEKCRVLSYSDCHSKVFVAMRITLEQTWGDEYNTREEDGKILCVSADNIFDAPPTQVLSKEVEKLNAQITDLKTERDEMKRAVADEREQYEQTMAEYAQFSPALTRLDEFVRQKNITHYFVHEKHGVPEILSVEDTMSDRGYSRNPQGKLLTLSPVKGRTLIWELNDYRDGSGSASACIPCTSHQEALDLAQRWLEKQIPDGKYTVRIVKFAQKYHLTLPDDYVATVIERERKNLAKDEKAGKAQVASIRQKKEQEWETLAQG